MFAGAVAVTLLVWGVWAWRGRPADTGSAPAGAVLETATVERRDFVRMHRMHGVVEAVQFHSVAAPRLAGPGPGNMIITHLAAAGSLVKKGDLLVEFDRQNQIKTALDRKAEFRDLEAQIKKKQAEHAVATARDETELVLGENALALAQIEVRKNEVLARIDAAKNEISVEEARARLEQLRSTFELKKRARQAELRILEIQRDRAASAMRHAERNAEKMSMRSPLDGLVVLNTIWKAGQMGEVNEGDEVRPGVPFLQVVNPAVMQVRARVNQADVHALRAGQAVTVRLDAYSDIALPGRVERIAAVGVTSGLSQKVRYFTVLFSIRGADPKLLPDLSAAVDVELERRPGALVAPRSAVAMENGEASVWVQNGRGFEKRPVKLGPVSTTEAVIESGLEAGAVVRRTAL